MIPIRRIISVLLMMRIIPIGTKENKHETVNCHYFDNIPFDDLIDSVLAKIS